MPLGCQMELSSVRRQNKETESFTRKCFYYILVSDSRENEHVGTTQSGILSSGSAVRVRHASIWLKMAA